MKKFDEMNKNEKRAYREVRLAINDIVGGYENSVMDGEMEEMPSWEELFEVIYETVLSCKNDEIRFAGKEFIEECIVFLLKKEGYSKPEEKKEENTDKTKKDSRKEKNMSTYREKEYFAVLRTRENMKNSPFMLFLLKGSSKENLEQELSDAGLVPFQNKLMTRQQLMKQDSSFYERVGIIYPEFEADAATAIVKFNREKTAEAFTEIQDLYDKAKNLGYCEEDNIYVRLQNAIVMA